MSRRKRSDDRNSVSRRQFVAISSAAGLAGVAGCVGESPGSIQEDDENGEPDDEAEPEPDSPADGSIHITQQVEPAHDYDPIVSNDAYSVRILNHFFDGLYEYGEGLDIHPKLAVGEPEVEDDGMRYIIEIVDDAEFHNGDPVTAEDVLHTFIAPVVEQTDNITSYDMIDVEASETIDDTTVQIDLLEPYAPFGTMTIAANVVNKEARLDAMGLTEDEWWEHDWVEEPLYADSPYNTENPIGSGPFQYVDHTDGEFTDMERWDDYWDQPLPELQSVRWVATEDDAARVSQILAGDTDFIKGVPPEDWDNIDDDPDVNLQNELSISYFYLAYNINEGPTAEADVRRGIEHAFSATAFVDEIIGPAGANAVSPVPRALLEEWELPADEYADMENEYDPEQAAELIEPHIDDVWEPVLIAPPDDIRVQLVERVAARLDELSAHGVDIEPQVQRLDWTPFLESYATGNEDDYAIYTLGWTGGPDPDAYMWPLFHEESAGINQGHFYDPDTDFHANLRAARESVDQDERRDLYDETIREILEEKVHTPTYNLMNSIASLPEIEDLEVHPDSSITPRLVSDHHNVTR